MLTGLQGLLDISNYIIDMFCAYRNTNIIIRHAGRKLLFSVAVSDAEGRIAVGRIVRVVVERERFLAAV